VKFLFYILLFFGSHTGICFGKLGEEFARASIKISSETRPKIFFSLIKKSNHAFSASLMAI